LAIMEEESKSSSSDNPQSGASSFFPADDAGGSVSSGDEVKTKRRRANSNEISENHEDDRQDAEEESDHADETNTDEVDDGDDTTEPEPKRARRTSGGCPVLRIDKETGKVLEEYPSPSEAAQRTGISGVNISNVLHGRGQTTGGFVFRYKYDEDRERTKRKACPVLRIDKETGKVLEEYPSPSEVLKRTGISSGGLGHVLQGRQKTAGGFVFRYKYDDDRVRNQKKRNIYVGGTPISSTPVLKLDTVTGKVLEEYPSITEAANAIGVDQNQFGNVLKQGTAKEVKGFLFQYKSVKKFPAQAAEISERRSTKGGLFGRKPVVRFDPKTGEIFQEYNSVKEAADAIGVNAAQISGVLTGKDEGRSVHGHHFRYTFEHDRPPTRPENSKKERHYQRKPVVRFDPKTGEVLQEYDSVREAADAIGVKPASISGVLTGKDGSKSVHGHHFRYKFEHDRPPSKPSKKKPTPGPIAQLNNSIPIEPHARTVMEQPTFTSNLQRPNTILRIHACTGTTVEEYANLSYAAAANGLTSYELSQMIEKEEPFRGFLFRYKFKKSTVLLTAENSFANYTSLQPIRINGLPPSQLEQRRDANGLLVPLQLDDLLKDYLSGIP
jgi:hypothetical protein